MAKELNEDTAVQISIKTLAGIAVLLLVFFVVGLLYKEILPEAKNYHYLQTQRLLVWSMI